MPVTIRDVSALAGVSMSTVSHVINNTRPVSEAARQRVLAAIRETGYTPNSVARSLKTAATRTIGLVVGDIANPYYTAVAHALETRARAAGYSVVLSDSDDDPRHEAEMLRVTIADDGIGLAPDWQQAGHYGLRGIVERAQALGGAAQIGLREPHGTLVDVRLPLQR